MSQTFRLTPHESVTVRELGPDHLTVDVVYSPGGRPPPAHFHPAQDEHLETGAAFSDLHGCGAMAR